MGDSGMYWKFFVLAAVLLMPVTASAFIMDPGDWVDVNCTENTTFPIYCRPCGNQTSNQTCPDCPACPTANESCGICTIDRELAPGEFYELQNGVCDVEISCLECEDSETQERRYTLEMYVEKKKSEDTLLEMTIRDFLGTVIENKKYAPFGQNDTIVTTYEYDFKCPTDVIIEGVSQRSCYMFYDSYMEKNYPEMLFMAKGQSECTKELVGCLAEKDRIEGDWFSLKNSIETCTEQKMDSERKMREINFTMETQKASITGDFTRQYGGHVPGWWMGLAILEAVVICFVIAAYFFGGTEGM